jgi:hypothetical protein
MTKPETRKSGRVGEVRCVACFERFWPEPGAERATCPACGREWYISWRGKLAKIRKPVWESWERQQAAAKHMEE